MNNSKKYTHMPYRDIQRRRLLIFLKDFCAKINLPDFMVDKIFAVHTKINDIPINQIFRGSSQIGFIGLCILSECINEKIETSVNYIANKLNIRGRDMRMVYHRLKEIIPNIKCFLNYPEDCYDDDYLKAKKKLANDIN